MGEESDTGFEPVRAFRQGVLQTPAFVRSANRSARPYGLLLFLSSYSLVKVLPVARRGEGGGLALFLAFRPLLALASRWLCEGIWPGVAPMPFPMSWHRWLGGIRIRTAGDRLGAELAHGRGGHRDDGRHGDGDDVNGPGHP